MGADIGYLSVALDMLSEYYYMSNDERVIQPIINVIKFIAYLVISDGTIGGEYGFSEYYILLAKRPWLRFN